MTHALKSMTQFFSASLLLVSLTAFAAEGTRKDDYPRPPNPVSPELNLTEKAGVGSTIAFSKAGVMELGGSMGITAGNNFTLLAASPSVGYFVADNLELSGILSVTHMRQSDYGTTVLSALAEPSFHLPITNQTFGFLGLGAGLAYFTNIGTGFMLAPRVGMKVLVGRSGIITPALFMSYSTVDTQPAPFGRVLGVTAMYGLSVGYTVMW